MKSARFTDYEMLMKMENNAYSNLVLDACLSVSELSAQDKSFAARLFYGVIERQITLDYIVSIYSSKPLDTVDTELRIILRMGMYQLLYMDSVPDNAAVNESVELCKMVKKTSAAGFVNAVLRNFIRGGKKYALPKDTAKRLCIEYSCNEQLVNMLLADYSEDTARKFLVSSLETHTLYVRVNNTKISADDLVSEFGKIGVNAVKHDMLENCLVIDRLGDVENNSLFKNGCFHVQDLSSQLCCAALNSQENDRVLDVCSAPGGKAFTIAEIMQNHGEVVACELHNKRVKLVADGAQRLGLANIQTMQNDAKKHNDGLGQFDKILCDVPCSGYGVIRSKPEIKYTLLDDVARLPQIQYDILKTSAEYLKVGGELVYSTCTVSKKENDEVIDRFLKENPDFEGVSFLDEMGSLFGDYKVTIFPEHFDCEGFFISKIKRIR